MCIRDRHTPGDYRLRNCVYAVYGREILNELLEVDYAGDLKVTGYISRPQLVRINRSYQHFYLNGRMIRSALLEKILEECYKDLIMPGNFPIAVLRIEVDPALVDVNVHPTKMEVRFSNENLVREEMYKAISRTLGEVDLMTRVVQAKTVIPEPPQEEEGWAQAFPVFSAEASTASAIEPQEKTPKKEIWRESGYYTGKQEILGTALREPEPIYESASRGDLVEECETRASEEPVSVSQQAENPVTGSERTESAGHRFPDPERLRLVGQVFDTYWMAEADGVLYIVDQHAAHERVLYDQDVYKRQVFGRLGYLKGYKKKNPKMKVALCGCMMQEKHVIEKLRKSYRWVDLIFGTHNLYRFAELLESMYESDGPIIDLWDAPGEIVEDLPSIRKFSFKASVNIMFGCNNFCTYCICLLYTSRCV